MRCAAISTYLNCQGTGTLYILYIWNGPTPDAHIPKCLKVVLVLVVNLNNIVLESLEPQRIISKVYFFWK